MELKGTWFANTCFSEICQFVGDNICHGKTSISMRTIVNDVLKSNPFFCNICNCYTMDCLHVRGDNPRALARILSRFHVDKS